MIEFFSRRQAAIERRYAALVRDYHAEHGLDPDGSVSHRLAQRANLDTRPGKKTPRSLDDKRAAWREELDERFGPSAAGRLMAAVPADRLVPVSPGVPVVADLETMAGRAVGHRGFQAVHLRWRRTR
jgi:hypothetical protein